MPPLEPLDPPDGDVVPYPDQILTLSGNRWLTPSAEIISTPFGVPCELQANTRRYWEDRAAVAGYNLDALLR